MPPTPNKGNYGHPDNVLDRMYLEAHVAERFGERQRDQEEVVPPSLRLQTSLVGVPWMQ